MTIVSQQMSSPVGLLTLVGGDDGLRAVLWEHERPGRVLAAPGVVVGGDHPLIDRTRTQLEEWFAGERTEFDLPLDLVGTGFQQAAWRELCTLRFGELTTYGDLADRTGDRTKARAIGAAVGRNPVSIIVPCHRVIGASGTLTGFAGGLDAKRWLLDHEGSLDRTVDGVPEATLF